jgi:type VI protein secretion system component VasF
MSEMPEGAVQAAAEVRLRQYLSEYDASHLTWRDFEQDAREMLEAAAPLLAEAWNLPRFQAEHEEWRRRGEQARRLRDKFWQDLEARYPRADDPPEVPGDAAR